MNGKKRTWSSRQHWALLTASSNSPSHSTSISKNGTKTLCNCHWPRGIFRRHSRWATCTAHTCSTTIQGTQKAGLHTQKRSFCQSSSLLRTQTQKRRSEGGKTAFPPRLFFLQPSFMITKNRQARTSLLCRRLHSASTTFLTSRSAPKAETTWFIGISKSTASTISSSQAKQIPFLT